MTTKMTEPSTQRATLKPPVWSGPRQPPRTALVATALLSLIVFPGWECGQPVLEDPSFELWCGDTLCAWQVDIGTVRRVATWHRSDFGVELVGNPAMISQLSKITSTDSRCLLFELQADRDDDTKLTIQMDFLDDGYVDYSHDLVSDNWEQATYTVSTPSWYEGVRFIVRKSGSGRAVLAHVRVTRSSDCADPPLVLKDRPVGAACDVASQCKSGRCEQVSLWGQQNPEGVCSSCGSDGDCTTGEACGLEGDKTLKLHQACGPADRHQLGERCIGDAECATGVCCDGVCSECCQEHGAACPQSTTCKLLEWSTLGDDYQFQFLPRMCSPGENLGVSGAACLRDDDCQSGTCKGTGELKTCILDGRRCQVDGECPTWPWVCLPLGIDGGTCQ